MSSSPEPRSRWRHPALLGAAALALLCLLGLLVLPRLLPYRGQTALDGLRFSPVVLDAAGRELQVLPLDQGLRRVFVPLDAMPRALVDIVVQAEDRAFWWHPGVNPLAIVRAQAQNREAGATVSGASTISMQLARILAPHPERQSGLAAKLAEAWEACQLETRLGKRGVLELYLNLVPFGQNIEGFPAAARVFFGRPLDQLGSAELLMLAVVPRSPQAYQPWAQPERNREAVLRLNPGRLSALAPGPEDYRRVLDPARTGIWPFRAPHYLRWLQGNPAWAGVDGRQPVRTAIEPELQAFLEELLWRTVDEARPKRVSNAAALFVRPGSMAIAAWVGSIDFHDRMGSGQVDGVTMLRQPGSTLKPFLYALALESGFNAASVLPDIPSDFGGAEVYTPANFNDQFNGPVRLRQALASSLNVPAVRLLERLGVQAFTERLIQTGFRSLESQRGSLGLGLALGNAELSLLELVQAYAVFLHDGRRQAIRPWPDAPPGAPSAGGQNANEPPVFSAEASQLIRDILTRHPDRVLAFGRNANSRMKFEGAIKTGTSNQFNNIWAIGFTSDLLGGVWMGNFGGQTVVGTADSGYPARIMTQVLESHSSHAPFPALEGFSQMRICSLSGMAASPACGHVLNEWFPPGTALAPCSWHQADAGGGAASIRYPQEYQAWLARYRYRPAQDFQDAELAILRPLDGAVYFWDPNLPPASQQIAIEATGSGRGELLIDGAVALAGEFPLKGWYRLQAGRHEISVENGFGRASVNIEVR